LMSGLMTPDYSAQATGDKTLQAAGIAPPARDWLQRNFAPTTEDQYMQMRQMAQTQEYQKMMGGLEGRRVGAEETQAATGKAGEQSEAAARIAGAQQAAAELGEKKGEFAQTLPLEAQRTAAEQAQAEASARGATAQAQMTERLNRTSDQQADTQILGSLKALHPEWDSNMLQQAVQQTGAPSEYFARNPGSGIPHYWGQVENRMHMLSNAGMGRPGAAVQPQGLDSGITGSHAAESGILDVMSNPHVAAWLGQFMKGQPGGITSQVGATPFGTQLPGM
jgi:hypothetical protein